MLCELLFWGDKSGISPLILCGYKGGISLLLYFLEYCLGGEIRVVVGAIRVAIRAIRVAIDIVWAER